MQVQLHCFSLFIGGFSLCFTQQAFTYLQIRITLVIVPSQDGNTLFDIDTQCSFFFFFFMSVFQSTGSSFLNILNCFSTPFGHMVLDLSKSDKY